MYLNALAIAASWKTPAKVRTAPTVAASSPASFDKCDALSNLFIRLPDLKYEPRKVIPQTNIKVGKSSQPLWTASP